MSDGDAGELAGKVAIVTGSGRGIGEQVARKLSADGASVMVGDIDAEVAEGVASDLPSDAAAHVADLTEPGACDTLVDAAVERWGRLDIVVNNAGYPWDGPLHKVTDEQFQAMLDIHTVVPFRVLRAAAPHLREPAKAEAERGEEVFRKVVNVTSLAGIMGSAGQIAYAAGKGGVVGLTRALAKEWGGLKINVNAVAFGLVETRLTAPDGDEVRTGDHSIPVGLPEKARAGFKAMVPLGRGASAEEAARGVHFLCTPASDYVHGQVLNVSGGLAVGMAG